MHDQPPEIYNHEASGPTIVMIADGWTRRVFRQLLESGQLPEIDEGLVAQGGMLDVVSNLPTVSLASHTTILTSTPQTDHGIVGHRWLHSGSQERRDYLGVTGPRQVNIDISPDVNTIFERYPHSVSVQGIITRGASEVIRMPTMRSARLLRRTGQVAIQHPNSAIVTWLPRGDALAHTYGPDHQRVADDMKETSRAVGDLLESLDRHGLLADARLLLVPDHGHRPVRTIVRLEETLARLGIQTLINRRPSGDKGLTLTSGDSSALVYLSPDQRPSREGLARKLACVAGIELACVPVDGDTLLVASAVGEATARYASSKVDYRVESGVDPLGLVDARGNVVIDSSEPVLAGRYPDFLHQVAKSFVPGRSGDLLLLAAEGCHFGVAPRLAWRLGYHRGSHGGPFEDEILVSAVHRGLGSALEGTTVIRSADLLGRAGLMHPRRGRHAGSRGSDDQLDPVSWPPRSGRR